MLLDVGANYGYFTCLWAATRPDNRVIAFEPAPTTCAALKTNVLANRLNERVTVWQKALGNDQGHVRFVEAPDGQSGLSHLVAPGEHVSDELVVEMTTLDDLVSGRSDIAHIEVLKIDAEGADALVIEGARGLLSDRRIEHVFFEHDAKLSRRLGGHEHHPHQLLRECGYRVHRIGRFAWHASATGSRLPDSQ
jgi:FkbM family methyltransferase